MHESLLKFESYVSEGYIRKVISPCKRLVLYNYCDKTTYEKAWDDVTLNARGTVYEIATGKVIARSFSKFFNHSELSPEKQKEVIASKSFQTFEKMDGCFTRDTKLNLWGGGTISIGEVVNNKMTPTLIGMNERGELVPTKVTDWHKNGTKNNWIQIELDCPVSKKSGGRGINKMKVTKNHEIFLNNNWKLSLEAKKDNIMTTYDHEICSQSKKYIYDMLLGDGSITKVHNSYRFTNTCKKDHEDFLDIRKNMLGEVFGHKRSRTSGYGSSMIDIVSKNIKSMKSIREEWYPNGKKAIPKDLSWMDDLSLAIWFMEDGSRSHNDSQKDRALFATNGFSKEDCERLTKKINCICGGNLNIVVFDNKGWNIRINSGKDNEIDLFWKSIRSYVPECMQYKLPEDHRGYFNFKPTSGKLLIVKKDAKILSVTELENDKKTFPSGRVGYDISTETTNYFAKGVLVHNSLGIVYYYDGEWRVNTRGSFTSDQAIKGLELLKNSNLCLDLMNTQKTFLVEIIYPDNKIIVDYGKDSKLSLLAVFDQDEKEHKPCDYSVFSEAIGFHLGKSYKFDSIEELQEHLATLDHTEEGYVVRLDDGTRVKFKSRAYLDVARLKGNMTPLAFWKTMKNGKVNVDFVEQLPEEFRDECDRLTQAIEEKYGYELLLLHDQFMDNLNKHMDRKDIGIISMDKGLNSAAMFAILDEKDDVLDKIIMRRIRPFGNKMEI